MRDVCVCVQVDSGDEVVLTELVFDGVFNTLAPEHCAGRPGDSLRDSSRGRRAGQASAVGGQVGQVWGRVETCAGVEAV